MTFGEAIQEKQALLLKDLRNDNESFPHISLNDSFRSYWY